MTKQGRPLLCFIKNHIDIVRCNMINYNCDMCDSTVIKNTLKGDDNVILIDSHSRTPIYEQIKEQIIMLINSGVYKPNDRLPSIRSLSKELNINVNTIKHAFSELEEDNVIYTVQGKGVFVCENPIGNKKIVNDALENIKIALLSGKSKGVTKEQIASLTNDIYKSGDSND